MLNQSNRKHKDFKMEEQYLFDMTHNGDGNTCRNCRHRERWQIHEKSPKINQVCGISKKKIKVTQPGCPLFDIQNPVCIPQNSVS